MGLHLNKVKGLRDVAGFSGAAAGNPQSFAALQTGITEATKDGGEAPLPQDARPPKLSEEEPPLPQDARPPPKKSIGQGGDTPSAPEPHQPVEQPVEQSMHSWAVEQPETALASVGAAVSSAVHYGSAIQ